MTYLGLCALDVLHDVFGRHSLLLRFLQALSSRSHLVLLDEDLSQTFLERLHESRVLHLLREESGVEQVPNDLVRSLDHLLALGDQLVEAKEERLPTAAARSTGARSVTRAAGVGGRRRPVLVCCHHGSSHPPLDVPRLCARLRLPAQSSSFLSSCFARQNLPGSSKMELPPKISHYLATSPPGSCQLLDER